MTIRVSTQEMQNQINRTNQTIQRLNQILTNLQRLFNTLTAIAWISPAARAMAARTRVKMDNYRTMLRAWQAQAQMLTNALNLIRQAEEAAHSQVAGLRTNAFNN